MRSSKRRFLSLTVWPRQYELIVFAHAFLQQTRHVAIVANGNGARRLLIGRRSRNGSAALVSIKKHRNNVTIPQHATNTHIPIRSVRPSEERRKEEQTRERLHDDRRRPLLAITLTAAARGHKQRHTPTHRVHFVRPCVCVCLNGGISVCVCLFREAEAHAIGNESD